MACYARNIDVRMNAPTNQGSAMGDKKGAGSSNRSSYPWIGRTLPSSAVLREKPVKNPRATYTGRIIDIPQDTIVMVLGGEHGWLELEATVDGKLYKGYVSQELIQYVSPKLNASTNSVAQYRAFVALGAWSLAVGLLTTFSETDRQFLLKELDSVQLARVMSEALLPMPILDVIFRPGILNQTSARQRVIRTITELNPTAAAAGRRWAAAHVNRMEIRAKAAVSVISRAAWGALARKEDKDWYEYPADAPLPLSNIVVHHTTDSLKQTVKELQVKEMDDGYSDMPYHFVITWDGAIHEGRSIGALGAHAGEFKGNIGSMKKKAGDFLVDMAAAEQELKTAEDLALHPPPSRNTGVQGAPKTR